MTSVPILGVFVPGALAGGLLVSLALLTGDIVTRIRGDRGAQRATSVTAAAAGADIRAGNGAYGQVDVGLRAPSTYAITALLALALVALALPGATWNFLDPGGYLSDVSWIWTLSLLAALGLTVVGATALRLVPGFAPTVSVLIGIGATVRFLVGPEDLSEGTVLIVGVAGTLAITVAAIVWSRLVPAGLPAWTLPALRRTPLGRSTV
jgi:hypothetical protein